MSELRSDFQKEDLTFSQLFKIIGRRWRYLFFGVGIVLFLVIMYNFIATPEYEATVVLKKEKIPEVQARGDMPNILNEGTQDEIETEMEIVKTRTVLDKVMQELGLSLKILKIVVPSGKSMEVDAVLCDYENVFKNRLNVAGNMPAITPMAFSPTEGSFDFYILKKDKNVYAVFDGSELLGEYTPDSTGQTIIKLPLVSFAFKWAAAQKGSKVFLELGSYYSTLKNLDDNIHISQKLKTGIFEISVRSKSAHASQLIANTTAAKFRETRIDQKQQTVRYSFDFVNSQLQDVSDKLKNTESELSEFKTTHKITTIDQNSRDIVEFLGSLETEKVKTDLDLAEYQNKLNAMREAHKKQGYFDQTYLTPERADNSYSPFSTLMRQLSDLELKRLELLQKRKETHPDVVAIDDQISQIKDKLSSYNQNTLNAYQIIINSLKSKQRNLSALIGKYSDKVQNIPVQETELADLVRQKDVYDKIFTLLLNKREEMRMAELSKLQDIVIVDPAHEPIQPVVPRKALNLAVGLILGLVGGLVAIFVAEYRNPKIVDLDIVAKDFTVPVLAIIPKYTKEISQIVRGDRSLVERFVTLMPDQQGFRESYRVLTTKISSIYESLQDDHSMVESNKKILMFTSCEENTGKTTVVSNLAVSLAESGRKVLIIDCDLKKPKVASYFDMSSKQPGLLRFLNENIPYPDMYQPFKDANHIRGIKNLQVIPAGGMSDNSGTLLQSSRMASLLNMLTDFDYILLDTPPVTRVVDVLSLGRLVKDVVLLIRPDHTFRDSLSWALEELEQAKFRIFGFIINACEVEKSSYRRKYGYGYGYSYNYESSLKSSPNDLE